MAQASYWMAEATEKGINLEEALKTIEALKSVRAALTEALTEVAPHHPLASKENRNKLYREAYKKA